MNKKLVHSYVSRQHMLKSNYEIYNYLDKNMRNVKLHHHDFYELYFFISGNVEYYIEGKIYHLNPGDIVLLNTTELHQAKINASDVDYQRIVLWIDKNFLKTFSTPTTNITACFEGDRKQSVLSIDIDIQKDIYITLRKLLALDKDYKGVGKDVLAKAYLMELMVKINNIALDNRDFYNNDIKKSHIINDMVEYIENNLSDDISIDTLAEEFYLSKYHLSREFKKYMGITIYRYITLKRLIRSKDYILQKDSITDVYKKSGFGDYSNFFRSFKKEYGITPKEYYKIMRSKDNENCG